MELYGFISNPLETAGVYKSHREGAPCTIYGFNHILLDSSIYIIYILIADAKLLDK